MESKLHSTPPEVLHRIHRITQIGWLYRMLVLFGCLGWNAFSAETKPSNSSIAAPGFHSVPLKFKDYQFVVDAKLNGSKCSTVIDTGCTFTLVDISRVKKARTLDPSRGHFTDRLFAEVLPRSPGFHTNFVILETLDFQGIQFLETPAMPNRNEIRRQGELISLQRMNVTMDYSTLLIGSDFLMRHRAIISCLNPPSLLLQATTAATNTTPFHQQLLA
jgi:hypothetical protein